MGQMFTAFCAHLLTHFIYDRLTHCLVAKCESYWKTVRGSKQEMAYGESNCHMTDDVTWPWKVNVITQYVWGLLARQRLQNRNFVAMEQL